MLDIMGKLLSNHFFHNPIFIVGGSRSGTIALLKAMNRHPRIFSTPSENPFITDIGRMAYDLAFATERDAHYYDRTLRISRESIYHALRRLALESSIGPGYGIKYLAYQSIKEKKLYSTKRHWCTKSFPGETTARGLQALYPNARFIWILRNGMNVIHSRTKFPEFRNLEFREHCQHWADSIRRFAYLARLPEAIMVRQEDLTDDPDEVFRGIFKLVGVDYHPGATDFAVNTHVHPLADLGTSKGVNVKETLKQRPPPYETWDQDQRATFKDICSESMALAGFDVPF